MGGRKSGTQLALCQAVKRLEGWSVGTGCQAMPDLWPQPSGQQWWQSPWAVQWTSSLWLASVCVFE